jgi:hypothetical protein
VPSKVGNSADIVWVRSTTRLTDRGAAIAGDDATAVAANAVALASTPRRDRLDRDSERWIAS